MSSPIKFDRKPYTITYTDQNGEQQKIRRVPPPKLHDALPGDRVDISVTKSDDFEKGDAVTIKHINPRHPNVVQVQRSDGKTTFLNFNEFKFDAGSAGASGSNNSGAGTAAERPINSRYLLWP